MAEAWIELPNGDRYPGKGAGIIAEWTDYMASMVVICRFEVPNLEAATRLLGARAQEQYPQLESGGHITLHLSQTEGLLDGVPFEFADRFVGVTGACILMSQDGPIVGADLLAEQINFLRKTVWHEGGDDGHDGDT